MARNKQIEYEEFFYEGKCIYLPYYGYIDVEFQHFADNLNLVSLNGKRFNYSKEKNSFYYCEYDTLMIDFNRFLSLIKSDEFKELSKEEFNSKLNEMISTFINYSANNI